MVRGEGVDDAARPIVNADDTEMDNGTPGRPGDGRPRLSRSWNGGGGHITAIILNETPASRSGTSGASAPASSANSQFPSTLAEAYAIQFGAVYLNFRAPRGELRGSEPFPARAMYFLGEGEGRPSSLASTGCPIVSAAWLLPAAWQVPNHPRKGRVMQT